MTLMARNQRIPGGEVQSTEAVVFSEPRDLSLQTVELVAPGAGDLRVRTLVSGISTGTERLLYEGRMPPFPGLAYPLVPGYETVGEVVWAGPEAQLNEGARVFVPGAACYNDVRSLFGGASAEVVTDAARAVLVPDGVDAASATLLSLAATAHHMLCLAPEPDLIIGHGTLGRLLVRLLELEPTRTAEVKVWEVNELRRQGMSSVPVLDPREDERRTLRSVIDVSGDPGILDHVVPRLAHRGEIVLGGFYADPLTLTFPPAFLKEARFQVAAEFTPDDLAVVVGLVGAGALSLDGLVTHSQSATQSRDAYRCAFEDPRCLKMVLNWENAACVINRISHR